MGRPGLLPINLCFKWSKKSRRGANLTLVEVGFMECNEPTITEAADACAASGADTVIAVPYFLHTGTHVADDLPTLLDEAAARHPHVTFQMGRYIGHIAEADAKFWRSVLRR